MRLKSLIFLLAIVYVNAMGAQNEHTCSNMSLSPLLSSTLNDLDKIEVSEATIENFRVTDYPIFLFDTVNYPGCRIVRWPGKKVIYETTVNPKIENKVYTFCGPYMPECPTQFDATVDHKGALLMDIGELTLVVQKLAPSLAAMMPDMIISTLAHEGFHYFGQSGLFEKSWPRYPTTLQSKNRKEIGDKCYSLNSEVKRLVEVEFDSLFQALKYGQSDLTKQKLILREFVKAREQRYNLVSKVKIIDSLPNGTDGPIDCKTAETRMELSEGGAEFVASWALLQLRGWNSVESWYNVVRGDPILNNEFYYPFGSLQLLNLILAKDSIIVFDTLLKSSVAPNAVYQQIKDIVESAN